MYKEIIIIILVLAIIIIGNVVLQNNTIKSVTEISSNLLTLRDELIKQDVSQQEAKKQMENIQKNWEKQYNIMAYYIEHNELEKVETELTMLKADIDTKEYAQGVENLDNCIFILKHIKDKSAMKIVNIF